MTLAQESRELLRAALDAFDLPTNTVSASARRALRIAALRRDYVNQLWLHHELIDLSGGKGQDPAGAKIRQQLTALLSAEEAQHETFQVLVRYQRHRQESDSTNVLASSLGQLESLLAEYRRVYDGMVIPSNLTPIDTYMYARDVDSGKAKLIPLIQTHEMILERVKSSIHSFLVATECELEWGQQEASLFLRAQEYINTALAQHAPAALGKFVAAQERLYSGRPEDLSHALTSCRRMIKDLADALYPPTGDTITGPDGVPRKMSDDAYRNRLLQYVREQIGSHAQGTVVQKTLDSLGSRLKSLDALASKGVHEDVSAAEAETCILWTYLLAGDLVRIADGTSALVSPASPDEDGGAL